MHADHLIRGSQYVKAEALLRSSLAMENGAARKSSLYVAFLQSLAFVREQEGDLEDAEGLYRMTLGYARPDLSGVATQTFQSSKGPRLPFISDPRSSLAAFYSNHGRIKDAEALYREKLAQASLSDEERLGAMRQLVSFLGVHGSKSEALQIEAQILQLLDAQKSNQLQSERYTLARLEVDAGRPADAKALLEADLERAAQVHGKESAEYRGALNYLLENRRYAGDYDAAEVSAREKLRLTLEGGSPEASDLASALFSLSYVRREQGHLEEAEDLEKRGIAANRAAAPQPVQPGPDRFAAAEALVRAGKADEALRVAQEIAEAAASSDPGVQFGFRGLAQLMHSFGQKPAAAQLASLGLWLDERNHGSEPRFAFDLLDWANFYRGFLHQADRAGDLVTRAEAVILACCGPASTRMEGVLQERAWCVAATSGEAASLPYLEQLRELRASIYGVNSRQVEASTRELAAANARAGRWPEAAKWYLKAVDVSARRTAGFGAEHVELLDSVAMEFFHQGDAETAMALNQRARRGPK